MPKAAWVLFGYLSGSILYARIFAKLFRKEDMIEKVQEKDKKITAEVEAL